MPSHFADEPEQIGLLRETLQRFVADTGVQIALACQRGMGAYGLSEGHDMERNVRDLLGMPIVGGSSAMQKNNLARRWGLPE